MKRTFTTLLSFICLVCGSTTSNNYKNETSLFSDKVENNKSLACEVNETCVRFCCDDESACLDKTQFNLSMKVEAKNLHMNFKVLIGRPKCESMYAEDEGNWEFEEDGKVVQIVDEKRFINDHEQYCFDGKVNQSRMLFCHGDENYEDASEIKLSEDFYPIWMLFSVPFLVVTFFIYACVRELRKLHGKAVMCYIFALILIYLSFALIRLKNDELFKNKTMCKFAGYFAYVSTFVGFFWLNVMSFEIWSTFRSTIRSKPNELKTFGVYCVYAFGIPISLTLIVFSIDFFTLFPSELLPAIGNQRCWIQTSRLVEAIYVYIPISIILIFNTFFYVVTAYKIHKVQTETAVIRHGESNRHSNIDLDRTRFFLYLRLFVITGITWTIDLISWLYQSSIFLHFFNILNCLQGVLIFLLFICKANVKKLLLRRYQELRHSKTNFSRNNSAATTLQSISQSSSTQTSRNAASRVSHKQH